MSKIGKYDQIELENLIQTQIKKYVDPHLNQIKKNYSLVNELQNNFEQEIQRVNLLGEQILPTMKSFQCQINDIQKLMNSEKIDQIEKLQQHQNLIDSLNDKVDSIDTQMKKVLLQTQQTQTQFSELKSENYHFKQNTEIFIQQNTKQYQEINAEIKSEINKLEQQLQQCITNYNEINRSQQIFTQKYNVLYKDFNKIEQNILITKSQLEQIELNLNKETVKMNEFQLSLKKLDQSMDSICTIEQFLIYYQFYHIQNIVSESLLVCLPIKFYNKYIQMEKQKFEQYEKTILKSTHSYNLQKLIDQHKNIVQDTYKRHQKISETIKNMDSSNSEDDNKFQFENHNQQQKIKKQKEIPQKRKQSTQLVYFEEQIKQLKDYLEQKLEDHINLINDVHKKLYKTQDEIYSQQIFYQANIDNKLNIIQTSTANLINNLDNNIQNLINQNEESKFQQILKSVLDSKQLINKFNTILLFMINLLIQDEYDKQTISLIGGKDKNIDEAIQTHSGTLASPININNQCLSCCGSTIQLLQFFKVACLHYKSSDVFIDGVMMKRQELLQKCLQMLQQQKQKQNSFYNKAKQTTIEKRKSLSIQGQPTFFSSDRSTKHSKLIPLQFV